MTTTPFLPDEDGYQCATVEVTGTDADDGLRWIYKVYVDPDDRPDGGAIGIGEPSATGDGTSETPCWMGIDEAIEMIEALSEAIRIHRDNYKEDTE